MKSTQTENAKLAFCPPGSFLCPRWKNKTWSSGHCLVALKPHYTCPYPWRVWASAPRAVLTSLPDQKSARPGCSPGLITKDGRTHGSNNWIILLNVIYTQQKYTRYLSLLYFLPREMTATFLTGPTALCLKLITPFKNCVAEDDCQGFASQRNL